MYQRQYTELQELPGTMHFGGDKDLLNLDLQELRGTMHAENGGSSNYARAL